jgi:polyphosphate kinase
MEHASQFIWEYLNVWQISAKFVHWLLINKNKRNKFLAIKNKDLVLHHPSYSADLTTCDFFLFIRNCSYWDMISEMALEYGTNL